VLHPRGVLAMFIVSLSITCSAFGATYLVPEDRVLIQRADAIVIAAAAESYTRLTPGGIVVTVNRLRIEEVLKGPYNAGTELSLVERGGVFPGHASMFPGAPRYGAGHRYLIFTDLNRDGEAITWGMSIGQFELTRDDAGRRLATHVSGDLAGFDHNLEPYTDRARDEAGFISWIRGILSRTVDPEPHYFVDAIRPERATRPWVGAPAFTGSSYLFAPGGQKFRWANPNATFVTAGSQPSLNGPAAVATAIGQWDAEPNSNVNYQLGAQNDAATGGLTTADGRNAVLFNDPNNELPAGIGGLGGISSASSTYAYEGGSVFQPNEVDVVINSTAEFPSGTAIQSCLNSIVTHEIGHTLGLRHADKDPSNTMNCTAPLDCSGGAIMTSITQCTFNGRLQPWDQAAISTVYGSGPPACTPPSINTQPSGTTIPAGQTAMLGVVAAGTAPLTYQWFIGNPPSGTPIGGATNSFVNVSPATTTTYFVRVTGQCGSPIDSDAATVTVNAPACPAVAVSAPAATPNAQGGVNLSVSASGGSGFTFTWFEGPVSGMGTPIGTGNPFAVTPVATTGYWVRAQNNCGNTANSAVITVSPQTAGCPVVSVGAPMVLVSGGGFVLSTMASGGTGFTFAWFQGATPGAGTLIGTQSNVFVSPAGPTKYSVRVTNNCNNSGVSPVITINPSQSCTPPAINAVSATPPAIVAGQTSVLSVNATGTDLSIQWFSGSVENTALIPNGTSSTITVMPMTTTTYFAGVMSGCGAAPVFSSGVTVSVSPSIQCVPPAITTPPSIQTIVAGASAQLSVGATGSEPLHFQWFEGPNGDTSKPVGTDSATFVSAPLKSPARYWVHITNDCGSADTDAVQVNVEAGRFRAVRPR